MYFLAGNCRGFNENEGTRAFRLVFIMNIQSEMSDNLRNPEKVAL